MHHKLLLRVLLTTLWLAAAATAVLWRSPHFWRAETSPPERAADRFKDAQALAATGRPAEALAAVDEALSSRPDESGYLTFKGYRELDLSRQAEADRSFRQALRLQPTNNQARLGLAHALAGEGRRDEALRLLAGIPAAELGADVRHRRGQIYALLSANELALQDLTELLIASPNDHVLLDEASTLALASQNWEAAASLSQRLESVADDPVVKRRAMSRRATALRSLGRFREAYVTYQRASAPDDLDARAELALQLEDFSAAISLHRALLAVRPGDVNLRRRLAYALDKAARRREAEMLYRSLAEQGAADQATRVRYAWLLNAEERYAEAWQVLAPLPRPSSDAETLDVQARTAVWAGEARESVPLLRALIERRPTEADLWKLLAESHRRLGDETSRSAALRSYVQLNSQDWKARQDLADVLARAGALGAAIEEYQALVRARPRDPDLLRALAVLLETDGRLGDAIPLYTQALEAGARPAPELWLRLARLYRWSARPAEALPWYQRYIAAVDDSARRPAEAELAVALLDSGDTAGSLARIQDLSRKAPLEPDDLLTGARAATRSEQPGIAAEYLQSLSRERPLDRQQRAWLAGQLRAAGQVDRALDLYEELAREASPGDVPVLEAVGDLRAARRDYLRALEAYRRISPATPPLVLKIARAAEDAALLDEASEAYRDYLAGNPIDTEGRLAAARYFARTNQPQLALPAYRQVLSARGPIGLRLELARVELEAEHFREAEVWARQALTAGEDPNEATLALAESLHLQGRSAEARPLLRELLEKASPGPTEHLWAGHVAVAMDRQLEGFRSLDRAIAGGAEGQDRLWLWRGEAARKRADFSRAAASYDRALAAGADRVDVDTARQELRASTSPRLETLATTHGDTNDLRLSQAGAAASVFLPRNWARLNAGFIRGELHQRAFASNRAVESVFLDNLFPTPQLQLHAGVGQERYEASGRLTTAQAGGRYILSDATSVGFTFARESLLSSRDRVDPREFNRILDLGALGPSFRLHRVEGFLNTGLSGARRLRGIAGEEWYQDDNRRFFTYLHYELPVMSGVRQWFVVRPNVYFETFRATRSFYFSPRHHFTLGTMLHGIFTSPRWIVEGEINPQMLITDSIVGGGLHGVMGVTFKWGSVRLGADTFIFYDGLEHYRHWRAGGRLTVPVGR